MNTTKFSNVFTDYESEMELLRAISFDPEQIYQIEVTSQDFTNGKTMAMYQAMLTCYSDGIPLDPKSVVDHSGGALTLSDTIPVFTTAYTAANASYHAARLREKTFARKAQDFVKHASERIGDPAFLSGTERALLELADSQGTKNEKSVKDILTDIFDDMVMAKKRGTYGIPTGFGKLNDLCIGFCPRHLLLLGAYTSHGKSTMLSQITKDIMLHDAGMVIFSVEDSRQDKLTRVLSTVSDIPIPSIITGRCDERDVIEAISTVSEYNLHVYDDVYTTAEMDLKIRKHKMRGSLDVVAIDFVQNIIVPGATDIFGRMSSVAIDLQRMAKRHNVCILALSQVSQGEGGKIALRGAQELASAADMVWWMQRPEHAVEKADPYLDFIVRKNRPFGKTGLIKMRFNSTWTGIEEALQ